MDAAPSGEALLRLLQLHDSQFPVGAFAHSNGLEAYAQDGLNDRDLHDLLATQVAWGWGRLDLAAWVLAYRARDAADLNELGHDLDAWKPVPGLRSTSLRIGRRTVRLAARLWPSLGDLDRLERPHQALVGGVLACRLGVDEEAGVTAFAHATVATTLAAATRCMPVSPERTQEILIVLHPSVLEAARAALADPHGRFGSATPGADLAAHRQAHLRTRLFQS